MPSFFEGLKRMLNGEPVYRPGEDVDGMEDIEDREAREAAQGTPAATSNDVEDRPAGPKIIPQASIVKVENRISGDYLDISVTIQNYSQIEVELESVHILGREYRLSYVLDPGEMKEFVSVYNGPRLTHRNYTECEVYYNYNKPEGTKDSFRTNHFVEFKQEPDGTYTISRIRFVPPVQDI